MDAEIGELPVDILDRGSDGSETEPVGTVGPADNSDNSDPEVDVENVEEGSSLSSNVDESFKKVADSEPIGASRDKTRDEVLTSDNRLLATILYDLKGIAEPKCDLFLNCEPSCSPETRRKHFKNPCQVNQAHSNQDSWLAEMSGTDQNQGLEFPTIHLPPLLQRPKEGGAKEEATDVLPPLKQAGFVQSCNKNAPLPLKHNNVSPHLSPVSPAEHSLPASDSCGENLSGSFSSNITSSPVDSQVAPEVPNNNQAIPPISELKRHFPSASTSTAIDLFSPCYKSPVDSHSVLTNSIHSSYPSIDSHSLSVSDNCAESLPNSSKMHSSHQSTSEMSSPIELHPVNCLSAIDFHSAKTGRSLEDLAHPDSTSGCLRNKTLGQKAYRVSPIELHPCRSVSAQDTPPGSGVFSEVNSNDTSNSICASSTDTRTPDTIFSNLSDGLRVNVVPTATHSGQVSPIHMHCRKSDADPHSSGAASEVFTNSRAPLIVNHEHRSDHGHLPPVDLHCKSPAPPDDLVNTTAHGHVNHTALSLSPSEHTINFHTSHRKCTSQSEPTDKSHPNSELHNLSQLPVDSVSKHNLLTDSQPPVDFHSKNSLKDNHITSSPVENQWLSTDIHPDSPTDEH